MAYARLVTLFCVCLVIAACKPCSPGGHSGGPPGPAAGGVRLPPIPSLFRALVTKGRFFLVESVDSDDADSKTHGKERPPRRLVLDVAPDRPRGKVRVSRLRWSLEGGGSPTPLTADNTPEDLPLRVAITASGLFLLDPEARSGDVHRAVAGRPDYPAAARPAAPKTRPDGRYVLRARFDGRASTCFGEGPSPEPKQDDCDGACDGMICFAERGAIVHLSGALAPENGVFSQSGFEPPAATTTGDTGSSATR